jgi:hypothetical protein
MRNPYLTGIRHAAWMGCTMLLLGACAVRDILPEKAYVYWDEARGRALLEKAAQVHGAGYWKTLETYEIQLSDQFYGFWGALVSPYPDNKANLRLQYVPGVSIGSARFESGKWIHRTWGIQTSQTYVLSPVGNMRQSRQGTISFLLPAYQQLIELPLRVAQAPIVAYIGSKQENQITYERVFVTRKNVKPNKTVDQFIVWINTQNGRIDKVEYTLRNRHPALSATAYFKHYTRFNNQLLLPQVVSITTPMQSGKWLHEWQLSGFVPNPVTREALKPLSHLPK